MSYTETVEERGEYRASIVVDESPHEPDHEVGCPVLRLEPGGWGGGSVTHTGYGQASSDGDGLEHTAEHVLQRFVQYHGWSEGIEVFERYIRIFHGGTVTTHSGPGWREPTYVAYTTERMVREVWGNTDGTGIEADMEEWVAYVEGEVYLVRIERKVIDFHEVRGLNGDLIRSEEVEAWEEVETYGGYYGERYAEESARYELGHYAPEVAA